MKDYYCAKSVIRMYDFYHIVVYDVWLFVHDSYVFYILIYYVCIYKTKNKIKQKSLMNWA